MCTALRATWAAIILRSIVIANAQRDEEAVIKAQGRLLAQLAETPIAATSLAAEVKPIINPSQPKPEWLASNYKWVFIGVGSLCAALISVLIAQWVTEVAAWRRQKRKLAQDEACRRHVELYATDIESPTKPSQLRVLREEELTAQISAVAHALSETSASQPSTTPTTAGIRLPASVLLRRAPSMRSNLGSISIRRSTSSREGTPRSPLGRRVGGLGPTIQRRTSSRKLSSLCSSPRSLDSNELTVDSSVKARDVKATGWAPHNHCHHSPRATSGPGTPAACGSPTGDYTLSPGRLEYRINNAQFGGSSSCSENEATTTGTDPFGKSNQLGGTAGNKQALIRMGTDAGLADFRLTTSVAEDEVEDTHDRDTAVDLEEERTSSSAEEDDTTAAAAGGSSATHLFSAKSIKPKNVPDAHNNEIETESQQFTVPAAAVPSTPRSSSPRTLALTGANVAVLSTEGFNSQVQLLRLLGAGGAGCVHQGLWKGMPVAVKILHPSRQTSASAIEAFRREVEVMARVGPHPGVIAVLATCLTPPNLAIIVELAERGSLHSVLHDEGLRPRYGTFLALAEDIACAISHCHSLKLVHRDLKAHNVLLDSSGRAKVADFGLAAAKNRTFLTVEPGAMGTASCMAPEQFAAHEVSERCDSYAFGCLLWELITGRQPWEECTNIMQIVMAVGCERRRPPIPTACPAPLARLIRECWRHNPALRPGFAEIIDRIRRMKREDSAAEALGAVAVFSSGDEGKKGPRSLLAEYILPHSSSSKQEKPQLKPGASFGRPGLSRLAISSS